ncbi:MAG TPA: hypothetical protein VJK71_02685, partial [Gemmatimonadales bacterium]|nr:hypothetical protein [Gemmatimonadales bacterium]
MAGIPKHGTEPSLGGAFLRVHRDQPSSAEDCAPERFYAAASRILERDWCGKGEASGRPAP